MSQENIVTPKVFISYSWTVQDKTIELANRLLANGIDIILDVYDLKDGQDKYAFMEQSVNDPTVNHVLIICDKTYAEKANARAGGVGDETVIITPEIYGNAEQTKFIPVIFEKDENGNAYRPTYIKSRIYVDLSDENSYEAEYEKLLRDLYHKPLFQKPALGRKPEWLENETVDLSSIRDGIKQLKGITNVTSSKADFLIRRISDDFINAAKLYKISGIKDIGIEFREIIDQSKNYRDLFMDYCEALIYIEFPFTDTIVLFFETLYNETHDATSNTVCREQDFEFPNFIIWEMFINMTALLLHYERYQELHDMLTRQYYLREHPMGKSFKYCSYCFFRTSSRILEETCKPRSENPKLFTLSGDIIVKREKRPILSKTTISNADIVLYQLAHILTTPNENNWYDDWFPTTYIYHDGVQSIWHKLKSQRHCLKIMQLLGVDSISKLKGIVAKSVGERDMRYSNSFHHAPGILSNISVEAIGTLP